MRIKSLHIIFILFALAFCSCEKPLPTELYPIGDQSTNNMEIEVLSSDPDSPEYNTGYDTTGLISPFRKASSLVLYNDVKNTYEGKTVNVITARAYFYDKSSPIVSQGKIFGYKTRLMGIVTFNNKAARLDKNIIRYRMRGMIKDTVTGPYYILKKWDTFGDDIEYEYSSSISFRVNVQGNQDYLEQIITPAEINGKVEVTSSGSEQTKSFKLNWNGTGKGKIEIIIGGIKTQKRELFPLYSIKAADNGELLIPKNLLEKLPAGLFKRISFSFIRKIEQSYDTKGVVKDIYIAAQSIHSIQLDNN